MLYILLVERLDIVTYFPFSNRMSTDEHFSRHSSSEQNGDKISIANTNPRQILASSTSTNSKRDWVLLNVGGRYFMTTRSTLSKEESFLCRLCQYDPDLKTDVVCFEFLKLNSLFMSCCYV